MRILENLEIKPCHMEILEMLKNLPDRAKLLLISTIEKIPDEIGMRFVRYLEVGLEICSECESPIEKILYSAFDIVNYFRHDEFPEDVFVGVYPQFEIDGNGKTYRTDFLLEVIDKNNPNFDCYIVVECDGHEFHQKTKQQVKRDNEREMALKMLGYDVLRFSGTQIYENPMKCANDIYDYVLSKLEK